MDYDGKVNIMTVIVNIWRGKLPQFSVWNAIYRQNVGHASMSVINDLNKEDTIYISHRPQAAYRSNYQEKSNKDSSKKYALGNIFTPKAEQISFDEDCKRRGKEPGQVRQADHQITISGLNEDRIRVFYKMYCNDELHKEECQYHILKNNCSTVVAYFLRKGLRCPEQTCNFCAAQTNQPIIKIKLFNPLNFLLRLNIWQILFILFASPVALFVLGTILFYNLLVPIIYLIAWVIKILANPFVSIFNFQNYLIVLCNFNRFWSPLTLEIFARKIQQNTYKKCQKK